MVFKISWYLEYLKLYSNSIFSGTNSFYLSTIIYNVISNQYYKTMVFLKLFKITYYHNNYKVYYFKLCFLKTLFANMS